MQIKHGYPHSRVELLSWTKALQLIKKKKKNLL